MADKKSVSEKSDDISKDNAPAEEGNKPKSDKSEEEESVTLTDEQWEAAFKSPRFAEINNARKDAEKRLAEYEKKEREESDAKMKKEGKLKELLEKKEKELEELKNSATRTRIDYEIRDKANKLGIVDPEVAAKLINSEAIEFEEDGSPKNIEGLLTELVEQKPYLVGKAEKQSVGSGANTSTEEQGAKPIWGQSELRDKLQDHSWYVEHKAEVDSAVREGRVDPNK